MVVAVVVVVVVAAALFLAAILCIHSFEQNKTLCAFETAEEFVVSLFVLRKSIKVMGVVWCGVGSCGRLMVFMVDVFGASTGRPVVLRSIDGSVSQ